MTRATQLGTAVLGLLGLLLGTAAPASACDPDNYLSAAEEITTQGPLVLRGSCPFWRCPDTAPALTLLDAEGREVPGSVVDYLNSGYSALVRWRPDVALEEGAEYTVQSDGRGFELGTPAVVRVVRETPVLDLESVTFELQVSRRDVGEEYCCGEEDSCGWRPCFGALGSRTIGVALAWATVPATHAVRLYEKGSASDDGQWQTFDLGSGVYEFDAPADELCVVLEVWDLARDAKRTREHCFAEHIEGLGEVELAWAGLDQCTHAPPVKDASKCLTGGGSLGPTGLAGEGCETTDAMLEAWCDANRSPLDVCVTPPAGSSEDAGTPDAEPRSTRDPGKCALAPGAPGSHVVATSFALLLMGLCRRRLGAR